MQIDLGAMQAPGTSYLATAAWAAAAIAIGWVLHALLHALVNRLIKGSIITADAVLVRKLRHPARWTLIAVALGLVASQNPMLERIWSWIEPILIPALLGWIAVSLVSAVALLLEGRASAHEDEFAMRSRKTRIAIFSRTAGILIALATAALILFQIPGVKQVGVALMASAGLAGIAVGAAAQPALKSLIAGTQMALTEPARIGDFVVIDGESGRVEDIRMTYVVIRTGDHRRLIVPTTKFLDASFQNWTRTAGDLIGTVLLPVRPGAPIAPIRAGFEQLVRGLPDWAGKFAQLQVGEVRTGVVELRLMADAKDPDALARLRAALREVMLEWLRVSHPDALCTEVG